MRCCEHAGPLRHVTGFPGLGLLRVLRPIPAASAGDGSSRRPAGCWPGKGPPGWFPRSRLNPRQGRRPTMPLQHRHDYAAGLHRGLPVGALHRPRSSPHQTCGCALLSSPDLPGFELVDRLRSVQSLVSHVRLSVSLAGPGPSGSAGPSRRCQGCFPPSPSSQGSGCPQLHRLAATSQRRCPFITAGTSAPRGAPRRRSTGSDRGRASRGRSLNSLTTWSSSLAMRETSDLEIPSMPMALTRSSTRPRGHPLHVGLAQTTATRACSARRRGWSKNSGL